MAQTLLIIYSFYKKDTFEHGFQTRSGPRSEFRVLTGSLGRPGQFFF
jgi:alkylated DNA repair dioxygenase AlkB